MRKKDRKGLKVYKKDKKKKVIEEETENGYWEGGQREEDI